MSEPTHTITLRAPAPEEQRRIEADTKFDWASYAFLAVLAGAGPALVLGWLGGWAGARLLDGGGPLGRAIGYTLATLLFLFVLASFARYDRRRHERAVQDARASVVQEIAISHPRAVQLGLLDPASPVLALGIGRDKVLVLCGTYLVEPALYGTEDFAGDFEEEFVNGLPAPYSFPSAQFTLTRLPNSGRVLAIRVTGEYVAPDRSDALVDPRREFRESELLEGNLAQIGGLLGDQPRRRRSPK